MNGPAIETLPASVLLRKNLGSRVAIGEVEHVGAVEVGGAIAAAQVGGVVAVVEEAQAALLVGGVE